MAQVKSSEDENFKEKPLNGERARWEDYHRYLRIAINKQAELPGKWLSYLFNDYSMDPINVGQKIFPPEFIT